MKMKTHVLAIWCSNGWLGCLSAGSSGSDVEPSGHVEPANGFGSLELSSDAVGVYQAGTNATPMVWFDKNMNRVRHMVKRSHFMAPTCVRLKSFWVPCVHPLEVIIGPFQNSFSLIPPLAEMRLMWKHQLLTKVLTVWSIPWCRQDIFEMAETSSIERMVRIRCPFCKLNWKGWLFW